MPLKYLHIVFCCLLIIACSEVKETPSERWHPDKLESYKMPFHEAVDSILTYHPEEAELLYRRSIGQFRSGDLAAGIANLSKAAELKPKEYSNYIGYVKLYYLHDYEGAEKHFRKCLSLGIKEDLTVAGSTHLRLGIALMEQGKSKEAIEQFSKEKNIEYALLYRGITKKRIGDREGALADFDAVLERFAKCPEAYYQKAKIYQSRGEKAAACKAVKKALLYKDYLWSNPRRPHIEQFYPDEAEALFDIVCR